MPARKRIIRRQSQQPLKNILSANGRKKFLQHADLQTLNAICTCTKKLMNSKVNYLTPSSLKTIQKYRNRLQLLSNKNAPKQARVRALKGGFLGMLF